MQHTSQHNRIASIDFLRGLVIIIMALDHVRLYLGYGTWYAEPTNLQTTTPLLFFTRWITHFCAPVFVFLAGTSAFLYGTKKANIKETALYLFTRGVWLILIELVIVNFAWTFDITFSFHLLQVIWAIGISMVVLSGLVFLPNNLIFATGILLVFGHNLLDSVTRRGNSILDMIWYALHQPRFVFIDSTHAIDFLYPVLPWIGLMAFGYVLGTLYKKSFPGDKRNQWLLSLGICMTALFIALRGFNFYGEPHKWQIQGSLMFSLMSFLNTTKYPPSLQFLLMTLGPALIFLSAVEHVESRLAKPILVFGKVPFFFYVLHLYIIHAAAILTLVYKGRGWSEYILSARAITSGTLASFGLGLGAVYLIWILVLVLLYPICSWYQKYRENNPSKWWLSYL